MLYFIAIYAALKAFQDALNFRTQQSNIVDPESIFPMSWGIGATWRNKWKGGDPKQGERFPGSSTIFVALTDPWHFAGLLRHLTLSAAVAISFPVFGNVIADTLICNVILGLTFELLFKHLFMRNFWQRIRSAIESLYLSVGPIVANFLIMGTLFVLILLIIWGVRLLYGLPIHYIG